MELDKIITLIKTVSDSNLTQFSLEEGNLKISMKTDKQTKVISAPVMPLPTAGESVPSAVISAAEEVQKAEVLVGGETEPEGNVVKSPLVGTFYNAPSPEAEAFVKPGDTVKKGQVLGIVEAMKLMNEIESEFDGVVKQVLVENEQVVEYGQPLFVIQ
ncbi:MAG: acetyl-CoA carboxylase biotin carboxyl carrier protein [Blautia sp.]|nr:acetyl-CoA carboxylase biotin carboxyl carrier protein [Bacillota bacterium]MDY3714322.1 acetyl-CoA carboxylase biotin carboxyl carrier protein [Blautia sp.]